MSLSSGHWAGVCKDAYEMSASIEMDIAVSAGGGITGNVTVELRSETYTANITGTVSGDQVTINENPPTNTSFVGYWRTVPNSLTGALQAMFGTLAPTASPDPVTSGGGSWMLWYRG